MIFKFLKKINSKPMFYLSSVCFIFTAIYIAFLDDISMSLCFMNTGILMFMLGELLCYPKFEF